MMNANKNLTDDGNKMDEGLFRALFELSPDAVMLIDPHDPSGEWPIVDCNTAACRINGYQREELIGQPINIVNAPTDSPIDRTDYLKQLRETGSVKYEIFHRRKNGELFPIESATTLIKVGDRELLLGIDRDITERKQAEMDLLLRDRALASSINAVFINDLNLKPIYANEAFLKMTGYTREEAMQLAIPNITGNPEGVKRIDAAMAAQGFFAGEEPVKRKDGSVFPTDFSVSFITNDKGQSIAIQANFIDISERKQAEANFLIRDRALASSLNAVLIAGLDRKVIYVNDAFLKMFGYTYEEAMQIDAAEDLAGSKEDIQAAQEKVRTQGFFSGEYTAKRKDGTIIPTYSSVSLILNEEGKPIATQDTFIDITERKQAEAAIHNNEEKLRAIYEGTYDAVMLLNEKGFFDCNSQTLKMFGFKTREEFTSIHPSDASPASQPDGRDSLSASQEHIQTAYRQGYDRFEWIHRRSNGEDFPAEVLLSTFDFGGQQALQATVRDITERKQAEAQLQQEKSLSDAIINGLPGTFYLFDLQGKVLRWNKQYEKVSGYTAEEIPTMSVFDTLVEEDREAALATIQRALVEGQGAVEAKFITKDGRRIPYYFAGQRLQIDDQVYIAGTGIDITERKQLETQVQEAFERRGLQVQLSTQVAQSIASASNLQELYERVVTQVKEQFGYYHTQLLRYDEAQDAVVLVTGYGEVGAQMLAARHRLPMGGGLIGTAAATGETVLRPSLENDPDWHPNPLLPETKGEIAVPIKLGDNILGVLDVQSRVSGALGADDQLLLEGLCGQIATAIESTRLRQEMARQYQTFYLSIRDGIAHIYMDGKIRECNAAMERLVGYTQAELKQMNIFKDLTPPQWNPAVDKILKEQVLTQGYADPYEKEYIRKDGTIVPVELSVYLERDEQGQPIGYTGFVRDITERKQAEETVRETNARIQAILDAATQEAIIATDLNGLLTVFNTGAEQMLGYTADELVGKQTPAAFHVEAEIAARGKELTEETGHPVQGFDIFTEYARQGKSEEREWTYVRKDGVHLTVHLIVTALRDSKGEITGFLGIARDITERKQAEMDLLLRDRALASSINAVFINDLNLKPIYANEAFLKMTGYTREETMQLAIPNITGNPEGVKRIDAAMAAQGFFIGEEPVKRKDGSIFPTSFSTSFITNDKGQPIAIQANFFDITERKQLETQIREAFERRGLQVQLSTQVSQSIAAASSLEELYERVVTQVKEQFGYYHTQILRYDTAQDAVVLVTGYGETGAQMLAAGHRMPMGEGLIGAAAATGETVLRPVLEDDPDWHPNPLLPETKGEIAVPIKMGNNILGVLDVQSIATGALGADDQLLLESLCGQIATAIEGTRLRQEMTERLEEINHLYRAMSHEGWQTYREKADIPAGFMYDQSGLRPVNDSGLAEELFANIPLALPGGEVIGTLAVANDDPQHLISPEDEAFLQQVSEQVALALESARLFEQTQSALGEAARRASELETVAKLSATTSTELDPEKLLQAVVDLAKERFGLYHAHVYTFDWNTLILAAGAGEIGRKLVAEAHAIPITLEQSLVARAARERKAIIVNDVKNEPSFLPNPLLPETCAEMAVPMVVGDKLLGIFDVQSNNPAGFSDKDANIYLTLAAQVGVALQNARLYVEQAQLVSELRDLDRLKSSFLANMSHELRTPLNSILGFADVILEELDGPLTENMTTDLQRIQRNGQHLLHLINDVLDMAKIEAGRMNLSPENFKPYEILEEVTSLTSSLASEKNLALFIENDSDQNVEIYADRTRLRQVMINLVNNAIKFTDKGKIAIKLIATHDERILITVKDTGIGIPADKLEPIFQEFTQVDSSSTRKAGGTGLGLPISRQLVSMHGGRLWAESTGIPGEGSTFFVELPIEAKVTEPPEK